MADEEQLVLDIMKKAGKPVRLADVAKMAGMDSKEVSKIISDLKKKGRISSLKGASARRLQGKELPL